MCKNFIRFIRLYVITGSLATQSELYVFKTPFLLSQYLAISDIHVVYQANIDICINYLQVVRSNLIMFQIYLAQKISRLVASFS